MKFHWFSQKLELLVLETLGQSRLHLYRLGNLLTQYAMILVNNAVELLDAASTTADGVQRENQLETPTTKFHWFNQKRVILVQGTSDLIQLKRKHLHNTVLTFQVKHQHS